MKNRPNFILFIADQLRFDYLGCNGHNIIKTPNIDKIASEGTNFSQFYVASQICMPNRASLMTGRYPSVHGLRYNGNYLPKDATTFIDVLSKEGYKTSSIGKIHLQPMTDLPPHPWVDDSDLGPIKEAWSHSHKDYTVEQAKNFTSDKYFNI